MPNTYGSDQFNSNNYNNNNNRTREHNKQLKNAMKTIELNEQYGPPGGLPNNNKNNYRTTRRTNNLKKARKTIELNERYGQPGGLPKNNNTNHWRTKQRKERQRQLAERAANPGIFRKLRSVIEGAFTWRKPTGA